MNFLSNKVVYDQTSHNYNYRFNHLKMLIPQTNIA